MGAGPTVSPNRTIMIVLSYIWILFIIPLIAEKDDPEVQWHAKHGLVLLLAEIALYVVVFVMQMVLESIWSGFGCALSLASMFIGIGFLALRVVAIVKGINGQRLIVPGVTDYVNRF